MKLNPREKRLVGVLAVVGSVMVLLVLIVKILDWTMFRPIGSAEKPFSGNPMASGRSPSAQGSDSNRIAIVPMGNFNQKNLEPFLQQYKSKFDVQFEIVQVSIPAAMDKARGQGNSQKILASLNRLYPKLKDQSVIAITDQDLFTPNQPEWRFVLSDRKTTAVYDTRGAIQDRGLGVISSARLDPRFGGYSAEPNLVKERLAKMLKKTVGVLYEHRGVSTNPRSVMYGPVMDVREIDTMTFDW